MDENSGRRLSNVKYVTHVSNISRSRLPSIIVRVNRHDLSHDFHSELEPPTTKGGKFTEKLEHRKVKASKA